VLVSGLGTDRTVIAGNYIGTNTTDAKIPNSEGITVRFGASDTRIGTDGSNDAFNENERNVISGNNWVGIFVQTPEWTGQMPAGGATTNRTVIAGNYIGTNAAGTAALGNASPGIYVTNWATNVRIGTDGNGIADASEKNIISGNSHSGVWVEGWTYFNMTTIDQMVSGGIPTTTASSSIGRLSDTAAAGNWRITSIPGGVAVLRRPRDRDHLLIPQARTPSPLVPITAAG
jgi:titin